MKAGKLNTYSDLEAALMVLLGCYGNGDARRAALGSRYAAVQGIVETILATGAVPDGSGADQAAIDQALHYVFDDCIEEITNEVLERLR